MPLERFIMYINPLQKYLTFHSNDKPEKRAPSKKKQCSPREIKDTYESTLETSEKTHHLSQVKKKIKSGYYNTNEVIDDLSEMFAKIFNNM